MNIEELLNLQIINIDKEYKRINSWIENNPDTDPNFYEMVDCIVEYGKISRLYDGYFDEVGYPYLKERDCLATHYDIPLIVPKMHSLHSELDKMISLRKKSPFFKDDIARDFFDYLYYKAVIAEYNNPSDVQISRIKKDVLCKTAGIYFYIWQVQQKEPDYKYDNDLEWRELTDKYAIYKDKVGIEESFSSNEVSYEGPQFGFVLEKMMNSIQNNSVFREEKNMYVKKDKR